MEDESQEKIATEIPDPDFPLLHFEIERDQPVVLLEHKIEQALKQGGLAGLAP